MLDSLLLGDEPADAGCLAAAAEVMSLGSELGRKACRFWCQVGKR